MGGGGDGAGNTVYVQPMADSDDKGSLYCEEIWSRRSFRTGSSCRRSVWQSPSTVVISASLRNVVTIELDARKLR